MSIEMMPWGELPAEVQVVLEAAAFHGRTTVERLRTDKTTRYGALMRTVMWYIATHLAFGYKYREIAAFCGRRNISSVREACSIATARLRHRDPEMLKLVPYFDRAVARACTQAEEPLAQAISRRLKETERRLAVAEQDIRELKRLVRAMEAALRRAGVPLPARA